MSLLLRMLSHNLRFPGCWRLDRCVLVARCARVCADSRSRDGAIPKQPASCLARSIKDNDIQALDAASLRRLRDSIRGSSAEGWQWECPQGG